MDIGGASLSNRTATVGGMFLLVLFCGRAVADDCGGSLQYQIVAPVQMVASEDFDTRALRVPDGADQPLDLYSLGRLTMEMQRVFPGAVLLPLAESAGSVTSRVPQDQIWVRGNLSRMDATLVDLGDLNHNFIITSTGGIEFLDLVTGEVYFSKMRTVQRIFRVLGTIDDGDHEEALGYFSQNVDDIFKEGVDAIAGNYDPGCVRANVVGFHGDLALLDLGARDGVAERQLFRGDGCELSVSSVQDEFCLARLVRGERPERAVVVSRIGANQIAARDGRVSLMVTSVQLPEGSAVARDYAVSADMVQQWVHDYLSSGSQLSMLPPASSLLSQQTIAGAVGSIAETVVRGSRALPDLFVRCRVVRAMAEEVTGPLGEVHGSFLVECEIEILDRRTGLVQLRRSREERIDDVFNNDDRSTDRSAIFERVTKNAIFELTGDVKASFQPARVVGHVKSAKDGVIEFALDEGAVGVGAVLELRRPGDEVHALDGSRLLGRIEERIGIAKVVVVDGRKGRALVVAAAKSVGGGDILFAACSGPSGLSSANVLQVQGVEIVCAGGSGSCGMDGASGTELLQGVLGDTGQWTILSNARGLALLAAEQAALEGGSFKITDWSSEPTAVPIDVFAHARVNVEPEQTDKDGNILLRERAELVLTAAGGDTIFTQNLSMTNKLKDRSKSDQVVMGMGPEARPRQYADMARQLLAEMVRRGMKEKKWIN